MKVEICVHCHSGPGGQYAKLLEWQLWSLLKWPPEAANVLATICCDSADEPTVNVVRDFARRLSSIAIHTHLMPRDKLFRRAIGRNAIALSTAADWVWFADCDYAFGPGCLDALASVVPLNPLYFPRQTLISADHATGDRYLTRPLSSGIDAADLKPKQESKAIGGIMIVPGDVARSGGYLPKSKWQHPVTDGRFNFADDVAYRRALGTNGTPIDLPNLYRIRHSQNGY